MLYIHENYTMNWIRVLIVHNCPSPYESACHNELYGEIIDNLVIFLLGIGDCKL